MSVSPSRTGLGLTAAAGAVGALSTVLAGLWVGLLGVVLAVAGVARGSRNVLAAGVLVLFVGVVAAAALGVPALLVVPAMAGTVVAWDVGENAIAVAEQFEGAADTGRGETLHAVVSAAVVAVFATGSYVVYRLPLGQYPLVAVLLLVVGSLVVLVALGR